MGKILAMLLICVLLGEQCATVTKVWLPNTNYGNTANWDKRRVPCSSDHVQLNQGKALAVSVRSVHTLKSLSLPVDGEVIFYHGAELHFADALNSDSDTPEFCRDSGDIHFVATVQDWYKPSNWQDDTLKAISNVILHIDNVPCIHDTVIFPKENSFLVKSSNPIKVAAIVLNGQRQSSKSFKDFCTSEPGSLQFNLTDFADITSVNCKDQTGCTCGNLKFAETICSHVKCKEPACSEPFKPEGSCCDICGTLLKLNVGENFNMDRYRDLVMNISLTEYDGVSLGTSKTEKGFVQMVLTDEENGRKAQMAAQNLREMITSEKAFGVASTQVLAQSSIKVTVAKQTGKPKSSLIIPLAVGLSILLLFILIAVLFLIFRRNKKKQSCTFAPVILDDHLEMDELDSLQNSPKACDEFSDKAVFAVNNPLYESATEWK
ncbi:protein amnionless-like [Montipora capricornis]|uniref:protein amnionless-like n=1 Tax=Montipora capricornis TaxID=246305 RepID=UPI0035F10331